MKRIVTAIAVCFNAMACSKEQALPFNNQCMAVTYRYTYYDHTFTRVDSVKYSNHSCSVCGTDLDLQRRQQRADTICGTGKYLVFDIVIAADTCKQIKK